MLGDRLDAFEQVRLELRRKSDRQLGQAREEGCGDGRSIVENRSQAIILPYIAQNAGSKLELGSPADAPRSHPWQEIASQLEILLGKMAKNVVVSHADMIKLISITMADRNEARLTLR